MDIVQLYFDPRFSDDFVLNDFVMITNVTPSGENIHRMHDRLSRINETQVTDSGTRKFLKLSPTKNPTDSDVSIDNCEEEEDFEILIQAVSWSRQQTWLITGDSEELEIDTDTLMNLFSVPYKSRNVINKTLKGTKRANQIIAVRLEKTIGIKYNSCQYLYTYKLLDIKCKLSQNKSES
ncbi:hypothetical protein LOTGIDRAFT_155012 [Lottia gigantea]|uniref:Uncharacterized protein n=1 Tax=Lottia gigantea TaxID=225164 RepID=V3ZSH8_LOTGI|nr:hypothetical protein LOTGIDRAFT_155012 [Lottia gigantea]ESO85525.1 hypothetical protein LOTGIDRAFT_155012 [Lottia gigantea]